MNEEMQEVLNRFLQFLFNGNAVMDNICYNLKYKGYACLERAIHKPMAHEMGVWADKVSDLMDELCVRPVRYALPDNVEELDAPACFETLVKYFDELRAITFKAIDAAENYNELEVKLFFENFVEDKLQRYRRQAIEWRDAVNAIGADTLNVHIVDYTSYLN